MVSEVEKSDGTEAQELPQEWQGWKLRKYDVPPELVDENAVRKSERFRNLTNERWPNAWMLYLFGEHDGIFGFREGNPHRWSRRKWIETFVVIQDKTSGRWIKLKLNEAQRRLEAQILRMERRGVPVMIAILKARQEGISTYIAACMLWYVLTHSGGRGLIMAHKKDVARVIQGRVRHMIESVRRTNGRPWMLNCPISNRQLVSISGPLNSEVLIESAESPDYRGDTIRFFHASELAFWGNAEEKEAAVLQLVPQAAGTYVFEESTANGDMNRFAEIWKSAWARQQTPDRSVEFEYGTYALFLPWFIHESYRWSVVFNRELPKKLREEIESTLSEDERWLLDQRYLRRGVGWENVDVDQLAWRRWAIKEKSKNSLALFHQEYPAKPEEAFLSTGMKLFDARALSAQKDGAPVHLARGNLVDPEGERLMMRTLDELEALQP